MPPRLLGDDDDTGGDTQPLPEGENEEDTGGDTQPLPTPEPTPAK